MNPLQRPYIRVAPNGVYRQGGSAKPLGPQKIPLSYKPLGNRPAFRAEGYRPEKIVSFEEAQALDEELYGQKVRATVGPIDLSDNTLDELMSVPAPTASNPDATKRINIGASSISKDDNIAVLKKMMETNQTESMKNKLVIGERLMDLITQGQKLRGENQEIMNRMAEQIVSNPNFMDEFKQQFFTRKEVDDDFGRIGLWLTGTARKAGMNPSRPLYMKDYSTKPPVLKTVSLDALAKNMRGRAGDRGDKFLDLGTRAILSHEEGKRLLGI